MGKYKVHSQIQSESYGHNEFMSIRMMIIISRMRIIVLFTFIRTLITLTIIILLMGLRINMIPLTIVTTTITLRMLMRKARLCSSSWA